MEAGLSGRSLETLEAHRQTVAVGAVRNPIRQMQHTALKLFQRLCCKVRLFGDVST